MPLALSSVARASGRAGLRAAFAGALTVGLLTTAPTLDAHAAPGDRHHAAPHKHKYGRSADRVARAARIAAAQKGDPYAYGAAGPGRFDCSGLTFYSFRKAGFRSIPRTSGAQARFARRIVRSNMRRGDLLFFHDGGGVYHVGVFAGFSHGRRQVLHAPYSGTRVRTEGVWTDRWFAGTLRFK